MRFTLPVLDRDECLAVERSVMNLRNLWTRRNDDGTSFTLGVAAYVDIPAFGIRHYHAGAARGRRLFAQEFEWLRERLRDALAKKLEAPVAYDVRLALPGFHIFVGKPGAKRLQPSLHFDLQDELLGLGEAPDARMSFTLPIAMPKEGGGLNLWDLRYDEVKPGDAASIEALAKSRHRHLHSYMLGELFVHEGDRLHEIDASRAPAPDEARITMQGHGRFEGGTWILYW